MLNAIRNNATLAIVAVLAIVGIAAAIVCAAHGYEINHVATTCQWEFGHGPGQPNHWARICR